MVSPTKTSTQTISSKPSGLEPTSSKINTVGVSTQDNDVKNVQIKVNQQAVTVPTNNFAYNMSDYNENPPITTEPQSLRNNTGRVTVQAYTEFNRTLGELFAAIVNMSEQTKEFHIGRIAGLSKDRVSEIHLQINHKINVLQKELVEAKEKRAKDIKHETHKARYRFWKGIIEIGIGIAMAVGSGGASVVAESLAKRALMCVIKAALSGALIAGLKDTFLAHQSLVALSHDDLEKSIKISESSPLIFRLLQDAMALYSGGAALKDISSQFGEKAVAQLDKKLVVTMEKKAAKGLTKEVVAKIENEAAQELERRVTAGIAKNVTAEMSDEAIAAMKQEIVADIVADIEQKFAVTCTQQISHAGIKFAVVSFSTANTLASSARDSADLVAWGANLAGDDKTAEKAKQLSKLINKGGLAGIVDSIVDASMSDDDDSKQKMKVITNILAQVATIALQVYSGKISTKLASSNTKASDIRLNMAKFNQTFATIELLDLDINIWNKLSSASDTLATAKMKARELTNHVNLDSFTKEIDDFISEIANEIDIETMLLRDASSTSDFQTWLDISQ